MCPTLIQSLAITVKRITYYLFPEVAVGGDLREKVPPHHLHTALSRCLHLIMSKHQRKGRFISNKWGLLNRKMLKGNKILVKWMKGTLEVAIFFWAGRCWTCSKGHLKWDMFIIFSRATGALEHLLQMYLNSLHSSFNMSLALFGNRFSALRAPVLSGQRNCYQQRFIAQQMWRPRVLENKEMNRDVLALGSMAQ